MESTVRTRAEIERVARAHLEPEIADRWVALLRPAIRLVPADGPVIARLGGRPLVPPGFAWPTWAGHGPLTYVGEIDLDAVTESGLDADVDLPATGRLLAFFFDGKYDEYEGIVHPYDASTQAGARLLHLPAVGRSDAEMVTPARVEEFLAQSLAGRQTTTFPDCESPTLSLAFGLLDEGASQEHPVLATTFIDALGLLIDDQPQHQLGGWPDTLQGSVENDAAQFARGGDPVPGGDLSTDDGVKDAVGAVAAWRLILQLDSDWDLWMMWDDMGRLFWLLNPTLGGDAPLDPVVFTWQS